MITDNRKLIEKIDKSNMLGLIENFDVQCLQAYSIHVGDISMENINCFVFAGMGGSAIVGDILKQLVEDCSNIPFIVHRDYALPSCATDKSLVFAVSYSGNTEETLSAFREAIKRNSRVVSLSSGGDLEKVSKKEGVLHIKIPSGQPPRCSLGYMFFPLAKILEKPGYIRPFSIKKIVEMAGNLRNVYGIDSKNNMAKTIAHAMHNKNIVIYSGKFLAPAALRWKTQIAENSKQMAFVNFFPEMNHNEIMAWNYPFDFVKNSIVFFLRDSNDNDRVKLRMELIADILEKKGIPVHEVLSEGNDVVERIFSLIILGDWISFYLALLNGEDPTEIKEITYLKKELSSA
ncbi:MAG: bifunctional phosphoglucose/phosphomannose isomerase [bacterium]|nr:bifunctional phosphoglucose/phosphomannose isomerase [bacterium]